MSRDIEAQVCSAFGTLFLLLISLLVVVMPWTEHFCHLDEFLHGGQDFELSLLCLLAVLCLVLVRFQQGKRDLRLVLALCRWLTHIIGVGYLGGMPNSSRGLIGPLHAVPLPSPALSKYNLPIQI
jgi:hypothetical protein